MKKNVRLKDIADALHISVATVSKALNNRSDVSEETRKAVLELAELYHYKPNYFAKFLHKGENNLVGVIVPRLNHSFFAEMIDGILTEAKAKNFLVTIAESNDDKQKEEELFEEYLALNTFGLIVAPATDSAILNLEVHSRKKHDNVVIIDRFSVSHPYHQITNNHYQGAHDAVKHLLDQGYRKIAHLGGLDNDIVADNIRNAYQDVIQDFHEPLLINLPIVSPEHTIKAMHSLMLSDEKPDAIFCVSDEAALGVYRYCYLHSISIPEELGLVGFSNASFSSYLTPSLTTVDQCSQDMGELAVKLIYEKKEDYRKVNKVFTSELIIRESSVISSKLMSKS